MISVFGFTVVPTSELSMLKYRYDSVVKNIEHHEKHEVSQVETINELRDEIRALGHVLSERQTMIEALIKKLETSQGENRRLQAVLQTYKGHVKENDSLKTQLSAQAKYLQQMAEPVIRMYAANTKTIPQTLSHAVESILTAMRRGSGMDD